MAARARLKNEYTKDEKCHNLLTWLKSCYENSSPFDTLMSQNQLHLKEPVRSELLTNHTGTFQTYVGKW